MENRNNIFGQFFKEKRLRKGLSLRRFCLENGLDAGNISKIERGLASPPRSRGILERYATCLGIVENSDDWYTFFDYAATSTGKIPPDVMSDDELVKQLPVVFRTLREQKLPASKLKEFAEGIRKI